jgi:hypothetical protein
MLLNLGYLCEKQKTSALRKVSEISLEKLGCKNCCIAISLDDKSWMRN